ncbi:MAG TPA: alkaline phosphatase family protein [Candidatus Cybelea sp.]|nr:alkaline phosphatase family protein [Candidatus Cybelea sp.]
MQLILRARRALSTCVAALVFCACNANSGIGSAPGLPVVSSAHAIAQTEPIHRAGSGKIKHVVIIVQENRSFNNLFAGYPGAKTAKYGYDSYGHLIKLRPIGLETGWDIDHSSSSFFAACNGTGSIPGTNCKMNGFNNEYVGCGSACPIKHPQYAYVPRSETAPYFAMAQQYVLADEMFASHFDASSFISHQYIISGQAESAVNYPYGPWGCPGGSGDMIGTVGPQRQIPQGYEVVCWDPTTLGDELDRAGLSWGFYGVSYSGYPGGWIAYQAIKHIYNGPDWSKDILSPPSQVLTDVANGNLRSVSWVTPTCANSDHAGCSSNTGPSWVTSIVNAVGESKYWDSTAIFIFWDDYGGWYDREAPAYVDYDGLGFRLPMLIVSAYAKQGHVSHVHYEHGSILKFVEDQFGLARLSASDTRAKSPALDCFDFTKPPRTFVPIQARYDANYFKHQPIDTRIPDWE